MKAVSLWQFWASLMAVDAKRIETRHWPTAYRGPLAIHAAQRKIKSELLGYLNDPTFRLALFPHLSPDDASWIGEELIDSLPFGAIVCVVDLYDCLPTSLITNDPPAGFDERKEIFFGNYTPGRFGWLTRHVQRLAQPVPTRGFQCLWDLPPAIEDAVRRQVVAPPGPPPRPAQRSLL